MYKLPLVFFLALSFSMVGQTDFCKKSIDESIALFSAAYLQEANLPCRPRLFLVAGYLNKAQALYAVPEEFRKSTRDKNAYDLALIRIGDESRIQRLKRLLQTVTVDDDFIFKIAPQLIYTRRREVIDFMFNEILKDQLYCTPADTHTSGRINCAYRLLELVAPVVRDFPLQVGPSGDLTTKDYPAALKMARNWILANHENYAVITDTY